MGLFCCVANAAEGSTTTEKVLAECVNKFTVLFRI